MRSRPIGAGQSILASQNNDKRDDARGGSFLSAHQQLGSLALGTTPSNNQTVTFVVNGTSVVFTAVTGTPTNPGDVKAPGTALGFVTNLIAALRRPDLTTSTFIALSSPNQSLIQYVGWAWPGSSTNIVPFSLNKNVNGAPSSLTSFNITTTVTSGAWTAQTMQLYIEDGSYYINGTRYLFTGGSTPTVTAPASNPRIDVLTIDTSGTLAWTTGAENASPVAPTYPANKVPICELYNVVSETALYDNENQQTSQGYVYNDVRPIVQLGVPFGALPDDIIPDVTNTRSLGNNSVQFLNIYGENIYNNGSLVAATKFGGTGADGALSITSGTTTINLGGASVFIKNYTSISITGTGALAFSNPAAGGTIIILKSQGAVTITSSATPAIDLRSMGGSAGSGGTSGGSQATQDYSAGGQGLAGNATAAGNHNTVGGGQGGSGSAFGPWIDGINIGIAVSANNSTNASVGTAGNINSTIQKYHKYYVAPGGGGSGAQGGNTGTGGGGGTGAGALYLECAGALNFTGAINAAGGAPSTGGASKYGGGGAGGSVQILYNILTANSGTITVTGDTTNVDAHGGDGISYVGLNTEFA